MLSLQDVLELAFSIVHDVEEYCLNFIAPTRYEVSSGGLLGWCTVPKVPLRGDSSQGSELCVSLGGWKPQQGRDGLSGCRGLVPEMHMLCFPSSASGRMG